MVYELKENIKKISEDMLWHTRLGHASLEYLKQLQKSEERLEKIKFDNEISEYESNEFKTPLSKSCPEKKSHLENVRRFGYIAYVKIPIPRINFQRKL